MWPSQMRSNAELKAKSVRLSKSDRRVRAKIHVVEKTRFMSCTAVDIIVPRIPTPRRSATTRGSE